MKHMNAVICLLFFSLPALAQNSFPFQVRLEPELIPGFSGLHSYAWARSGEQILLLGGRKDGLHRRQPFASFNSKDNNTEIIVLDPEKERCWTLPLTAFEPEIREQLQSSNMEFYQDAGLLLLSGGYGYSETRKDHITHPALLIVQVGSLIEAVIEKKEPVASIRRIPDERMAVTGGRLNKLDGYYYLAGGQKFAGRYNPHGPDHGPGYHQEYSNQVRKFTIITLDEVSRIGNYSAITDSNLLHRRDYNLLPQFDETGHEMLSIFSGVFQPDKDLPYSSIVDLSGNTIREFPGFSQQFSHYHTASLPVWDPQSATAYAVFFGGIARNYFDSSGQKVSDENIPFVKHISVVERQKGKAAEYLLPVQFTGYFGTTAEFIPSTRAPFSPNGVLLTDQTGKKEFLAGYIIGGIDSRSPNVLWSNQPDASRASPVIWRVYLKRK